jgi:flagellum-specific peptidoglycan hydrolase FlgJ
MQSQLRFAAAVCQYPPNRATWRGSAMGISEQGDTMADERATEKVEELSQLMRHIEAEMSALRRATDTGAPKRAPDVGDTSIEQRVLYLEELVSELFRMMRTFTHPEPQLEVHRGPADGIAIVVGHEADKPGADALTPPFQRDKHMSYEYFWNTELAKWIVEEATAANIRAKIFYRDDVGVTGAYKQVRAWSPKATVELHFNAASGTARGTETIYGGAKSLAWAETLQAEIVKLYDRQGKLNRGLEDRSNDGRGKLSVTQIHPSALIEPFFGDNPDDCNLAVEHKRRLARTLVRAYAKFTGVPFPEGAPEPKPAPPTPPPSGTEQPSPKPPVAPPAQDAPGAVVAAGPAPAPGPAVVAAALDTTGKPERFSDVFWQLAQSYQAMAIDHPHLKGVTLAQWALESGFGSTALAKEHLNFAGMKWREVMKPYATSVSYEAHDGREDYCKFASVDDFIKGFWARLDLMPPYAGWRDNAKTPESFIGFIAEIWAPKQNYEAKVLDLYRRMAEAGQIPSGLLVA